VGAAMSGAVIIAKLIGDDTAQAGEIVVRSRSPVFALCRALLAAGANPNSRLECFRGSVLALTVKTIGFGAKLTVKENNWVGPKVVPYEPFSRDRVGRHVRQNDDPAPSPLSDDSLAEGTPGGTKIRAEPSLRKTQASWREGEPPRKAQQARSPGMRSGGNPIEMSASLQTSAVNWSMAAAMMGDSTVTDPLSADAPDNWDPRRRRVRVLLRGLQLPGSVMQVWPCRA
jgi:hypothetical protein